MHRIYDVRLPAGYRNELSDSAVCDYCVVDNNLIDSSVFSSSFVCSSFPFFSGFFGFTETIRVQRIFLYLPLRSFCMRIECRLSLRCC